MLPTCRIFRNGGRGTPFSRSSRSGGLWRWPKSPKLCSLFPGNQKIFMCFRFLRKKNCIRTHVATGRWSSKLQARLCVEKLCLCLVHRWSFIVCANFSCFCNGKLCFGMENFQIIHAAFEHGEGLPFYRERQFWNNRFCRQTLLALLSLNTRGPRFDWLCYRHIIVSEVS